MNGVLEEQAAYMSDILPCYNKLCSFSVVETGEVCESESEWS